MVDPFPDKDQPNGWSFFVIMHLLNSAVIEQPEQAQGMVI
jgi:hypothetical protein